MHDTTKPYDPYQDTPYEPHWALANLQGGEHPALDDLQASKEYPQETDYWEALGGADPTVPGWVPWWFPRTETRMRPGAGRWIDRAESKDITPEQRLAWFDKALQHYAPKELNPNDKSNSMMRNVAISLLRMRYAAALEEIPTPDKL